VQPTPPTIPMTTSKRNNFAVDLADLERKLASNITSTSTDHVNTRWNPPATQHNQSATKISTLNFDHTQLQHTPTITHCVKRWTPPATLQQQHDGVLAGKNHNNAPVAAFAVTPQRDENESEIERVKCINRSNQNKARARNSHHRLHLFNNRLLLQRYFMTII
jgi:hypothetical protein